MKFVMAVFCCYMVLQAWAGIESSGRYTTLLRSTLSSPAHWTLALVILGFS